MKKRDKLVLAMQFAYYISLGILTGTLVLLIGDAYHWIIGQPSLLEQAWDGLMSQ